jgi:hypothetical protein
VNLCCRGSVDGSVDIDRRPVDYVWTHLNGVFAFWTVPSSESVNDDLIVTANANRVRTQPGVSR